ncbi:MAG: hypothetical protein AAGK78_15445 [Planctomycetota bacterium]
MPHLQRHFLLAALVFTVCGAHGDAALMASTAQRLQAMAEVDARQAVREERRQHRQVRRVAIRPAVVHQLPVGFELPAVGVVVDGINARSFIATRLAFCQHVLPPPA